MHRYIAAMAALALSFPIAPAAAQVHNVVSVVNHALTDEDAVRVKGLLGIWAGLVRSETGQMLDPLAWVRRHPTHLMLPPGAVYDGACSALTGKAVFTLGAEPAPEEMAELTDAMMRYVAFNEIGTPAPASLARAPVEPAPAMDGMIEGVLAGRGLGEIMGVDAVVREGIRVRQGIESGPSLRLMGRIDDWYTEQGFVYNNGLPTHTGDERDGSVFIWGENDGIEDVRVELDAFNEQMGLDFACALLPRGPKISVGMHVGDALETAETVQGRLRAMNLASLGGRGGDYPSLREADRALAAQGLTVQEFMTLLAATADAAWFADNPRIREAILGEARRDPANPVASSMLQHAENVGWYERHRAGLESALADWRRAFGAGR